MGGVCNALVTLLSEHITSIAISIVNVGANIIGGIQNKLVKSRGHTIMSTITNYSGVGIWNV